MYFERLSRRLIRQLKLPKLQRIQERVYRTMVEILVASRPDKRRLRGRLLTYHKWLGPDVAGKLTCFLDGSSNSQMEAESEICVASRPVKCSFSPPLALHA